jgi:DNA-binding beta-propeller fold protein YncE
MRPRISTRTIGLALGATLSLPSVAAPQLPQSLTGTLVVTNKGAASASIIDIASGAILATVPTGNGPHEVALTGDGALAIVTDYGARQGGGTLTVIDVPGMRVARTINLGQYTRPHGIAVLPGDSLVAVTSESTQNVVIVNVRAGTVRSAIPTEHAGSHMVAVTADGSRFYTGDIGSNTVSELDPQTGRRTQSWDVPSQPEAINVTPDGSEVWVGSNAEGKVSVLDPRTGEIRTAAEEVGWPYRILFTPDQQTVLLPDLRREELRFIDRRSHRELGRMRFTDAGPQGITLTPDGRYAFQSLSQQQRVAVIDVANRRVLGHLPTGAGPDGVVYTSRVFAR